MLIVGVEAVEVDLLARALARRAEGDLAEPSGLTQQRRNFTGMREVHGETARACE